MKHHFTVEDCREANEAMKISAAMRARAKKRRPKKRPSKLVGSGRLVGALRAEIESLRRDAARLDALERLWRREIHLTREMTDIGDWCVVKVWSTKYLSSYNYEGESVRDALDDLMAKHPNTAYQPPKGEARRLAGDAG